MRGMGNMQGMMKQMQKMQKQMAKAAEELGQQEFEATAGGGAVVVKISGNKEILGVSLKPEVVDPDDIEMLQDLIQLAVNDALSQVESASNEQMGQFTQGLPKGMF